MHDAKGPESLLTLPSKGNLPFLTLRQKEKEGRMNRGEHSILENRV